MNIKGLTNNVLQGATKNPLAFAIGAILIIALLFYFKGALADLFFIPETLPQPTGGTKLKKSEIDKIVTDLYESLDGIFDSKESKEKAARAALDLSDGDLIRVYNEFNRRYQNEKSLIGFFTGDKKGTLINWIEDEWFRGADYLTLTSPTAELIKRLKRLKGSK